MALPDFGLMTKADKQKLDTIPSDALLTESTANQTYLTQTAAANTYLTQSAASTTYLKKTDAASTYLTQTNAANTYMTKTAAQNYINEAVANAGGGGGISLSKSSTINVTPGGGTITAANSDKYVMGSKISDTIHNLASNVIIDEVRGSNVIFDDGDNNIFIYRADANSTICGFGTNDTLYFDSPYVGTPATTASGLAVTIGGYQLLLRGPRKSGGWRGANELENFETISAGTNIKFVNVADTMNSVEAAVAVTTINAATTNSDDYCQFMFAGGSTGVLYDDGDYNVFFAYNTAVTTEAQIYGFSDNDILYIPNDTTPVLAKRLDDNSAYIEYWTAGNSVSNYWRYFTIRGKRISGKTANEAASFSDMVTALGPQDKLLVRNIAGRIWYPTVYAYQTLTTDADDVTNTEDYQIIDLGSGKDTIHNSGAHCSIYGNASVDNIYNDGDYCTLDGGAANDTVINSGDYVYITNATGNGTDRIENSGDFCTIVGGTGNETVINGGNYCSILGNASIDSIANTGSYCTIVGGKGNDYIYNDGTNNVYVVNSGDANDTLCGFGANDTLLIVGANAIFQTTTTGYLASISSSQKVLIKGSRISGKTANALASFNALSSGFKMNVYNNSEELTQVTV